MLHLLPFIVIWVNGLVIFTVFELSIWRTDANVIGLKCSFKLPISKWLSLSQMSAFGWLNWCVRFEQILCKLILRRNLEVQPVSFSGVSAEITDWSSHETIHAFPVPHSLSLGLWLSCCFSTMCHVKYAGYIQHIQHICVHLQEQSAVPELNPHLLKSLCSTPTLRIHKKNVACLNIYLFKEQEKKFLSFHSSSGLHGEVFQEFFIEHKPTALM